jgi:uncharacterized protein (UPF0335 family)
MTKTQWNDWLQYARLQKKKQVEDDAMLKEMMSSFPSPQKRFSESSVKRSSTPSHSSTSNEEANIAITKDFIQNIKHFENSIQSVLSKIESVDESLTKVKSLQTSIFKGPPSESVVSLSLRSIVEEKKNDNSDTTQQNNNTEISNNSSKNTADATADMRKSLPSEEMKQVTRDSQDINHTAIFTGSENNKNMSINELRGLQSDKAFGKKDVDNINQQNTFNSHSAHNQRERDSFYPHRTFSNDPQNQLSPIGARRDIPHAEVTNYRTREYEGHSTVSLNTDLTPRRQTTRSSSAPRLRPTAPSLIPPHLVCSLITANLMLMYLYVRL